ncbi:MAG TPA: hypothetical protein VF808_12290 [Ktedonobacterales bacterium]
MTTGPRRLTPQWALRAILPALVVVALAGCAAATTANHPSATMTPAPTVTPRTLYQANWKSGAGQWNLPTGWRLTPDGLTNGGHSLTKAEIPFTPAVANYTITITLQVNAVVGPSACGNAFGLEGQTASGAPVYDALISCIDHGYHGFSYVYCSNADGGMNTYDYTTGVSSRTYVINVEGQYVSYMPSGSFLGTSHCSLPTSPVKLTLVNTGMDTIIQDITITTP